MQTDYDIESKHDPHEEELPQVEVLVLLTADNQLGRLRVAAPPWDDMEVQVGH
jgi:hypothetical protein